MRTMSLMQSARYVRRPNASIPQVVPGSLVSLWGLFTVLFASLTAYADVFAGPGAVTRQQYDDLGRPYTGWSEVWHTFGPLLWAVYAAGLLLVIARMWHIILTKPPRAGWMYLPFVLGVCAVFWAFDLDRFLTT